MTGGDRPAAKRLRRDERMPGAAAVQILGAAGARLRKATVRERLLLGGLALGLAIAAPLLAQGWSAEQAAREADDVARLRQLQAASSGPALRLAQARVSSLEARVRSWTPAAPSYAVSRVLVEQDAALAAAQAGFSALEVRAAETPDVVGGVSFVRVELSGSGFTWGRLGDFVRRIASARPGAVVERSATEGDPPDVRLRMVLLAPVRVTPA